MKHTQSPTFSKIRWLFLALAIVCLAAHADDYSDVSQLVRAGKLPEALTRADQYLSTQPKDPQMRFIKGVIQRDSGKSTEAITTFTRLTEDYPELPEPYNNLAVLYAGLGQFDKARATLEMAIRTNPSYATAHENLGDIYAKLASQAYNMALQLDTANAQVPTKLALIREIFGSPGTKPTHPAITGQPVVTPATATIKPPTLAVAPSTPAFSVAPKPVAPMATPVPAPVPAPSPTPATTPVPTPPVLSAPASQATPPAATKAPIDTATPAATANASNFQAREVEAAVAKWASAWSARDVKADLAAYAKDFDPPGSVGRKAWEDERTQRITSKASISVKVDKLAISVNGNHATAKFRQDYKAGGLAVSSHETLEFTKLNDQWQIVKETVGG
jgi:tetratricopeptide (TPR) repeat protein